MTSEAELNQRLQVFERIMASQSGGKTPEAAAKEAVAVLSVLNNESAGYHVETKRGATVARLFEGLPNERVRSAVLELLVAVRGEQLMNVTLDVTFPDRESHPAAPQSAPG